MHKRRQARIDALARMRAMAEQREELALEHAAVVVRKADLELRLTSSKLDCARSATIFVSSPTAA